MDRRRFLKDSALYTGLIGATGWKGNSYRVLREGGPDRPTGGKPLNLNDAVVVAPGGLSSHGQKAVQVLIEEVGIRTELRLPVVHQRIPDGHPAIVVASEQILKELKDELPRQMSATGEKLSHPEGYRLLSGSKGGSPLILVSGGSERGVLFAVGGLLRRLRMSKQQIGLRGEVDISSSPKYKLRGHQLGYRATPNSYDGWTVAMWDQYIRDLAVFGTNAIELIPPEPKDQSPHFWLPAKQMMVEMSRIADEYGLDVWVWYPALGKDSSNPQTVDVYLKQCEETFRTLPRLNGLFVPGGDPGNTRPAVLMGLLEKQTAVLRRYHPHATTWVSTQEFSRAWLEEFYSILERDHPRWLSGVVYGPHNRVDLAALRKRVPSEYPIRLYPDITHTVECQFPVPDWDSAYAFTEGREPINPRPLAYGRIARQQLPLSIGFLAYSEGCNDDVNKIIWSSLAWDPRRSVIDILREYSRYFIGDRYEEDFAQGLLSLERNWKGPLLTNQGVNTTLQQFQSMEKHATPHDLLKWRFQQGLYRAYYDAYVRSRLLYETDLENRAMRKLEEIHRPGTAPVLVHKGESKLRSTSELKSSTVVSEAMEILNQAQERPVGQDWRTKILQLGEALYQSIRMQLSVELYKGEAVSRGANLDTLDAPLTNGPWLIEKLGDLTKLTTVTEQVREIEKILNRENPGPGGFYDDLGDLTRQPHLVRGLGGCKDPEFYASSLVGYSGSMWTGVTAPVSWKRWAGSLYDAPLKMHYEWLDPRANYTLRVTYSGDEYGSKIELHCNDGQLIHPLMKKPWPPRPLEFDIPRHATQNGNLTLIWNREPGLGGNGRGCQVAEVWIIKGKE